MEEHTGATLRGSREERLLTGSRTELIFKGSIGIIQVDRGVKIPVPYIDWSRNKEQHVGKCDRLLEKMRSVQWEGRDDQERRLDD